jgi:hypothetical protein
MSITFSCPHCFRRYKVKDDLAGVRKDCKQCGRAMVIPGGPAPRQPRELVLRDAVRARLVALRLLSGATAEPTLEVDRVADVEEALRCVLPDEVLAMLASGVEDLREGYGIDLALLGDYPSRDPRLPRDLLPIGEGGEGHLLYCITRTASREEAAGLTIHDNEDQSTSYRSLPDWPRSSPVAGRCWRRRGRRWRNVGRRGRRWLGFVRG